MKRHLPFTIALIPFAILVFATTAFPQAPSKTVTLVIDFGDKESTKRYDKISWREKMTVIDAMNAAKKADKSLTFESRGSGRTTFVTKIGSLKNQGSNGNNWLFRVNKKLGDRSAAIYRIRAGDIIRWEFGEYE